MATLSPIPSMNDLKVKFNLSTLIFPSQETSTKSIFLPNIDQLLNYNIPTAHFFLPSKDFTPQFVAERLKLALERVLVPYDFMAGRLKLNYESGGLEIDCNAAGAGFVVASSECRLDEIMEFLACPNLGYRQLAVQKIDDLAMEDNQQPLCVFQVTSFKCGGFALGVSTNHILLDGLGARTFLENVASQAFDDDRPLVIPASSDRRILAARNPPMVKFPHTEFLQLDLPVGKGSSPPVFDCILEDLEYRIFKFNSKDINHLKDNTTLSTPSNGINGKVTTFGVVSALIWRCKVLSREIVHEKDELSNLIIAINIRPRLKPPLQNSYAGNAVLPITVSATYEELEKGPLYKLVESIREGGAKMTDEYARSALDWLEVHRGIPHADYVISSWLGLGFEEVAYPWGKPVYSCPVVNHRKDICWVFSDTENGTVNALVALPKEEMETFDSLFHKFLD